MVPNFINIVSSPTISQTYLKVRKIDVFNFLRQNDDLKKFNEILTYTNLLMDSASGIIEDHPLLDVVRLLGRPLQTQYLTQILFNERIESDKVPQIDCDHFMFGLYDKITVDGKTTLDVIERIEGLEKEVMLGRDLVLPWPWNRDRSINSIVNIGRKRPMGEWKQDFSNHRVTLWLPMGIAWVGGGNHSIAAGIIKATGKITPDYIYDISKVYDYVYCDGKNYIRKTNYKKSIEKK